MLLKRQLSINALNELEHQWLMKYKHKVLPAQL